MHYQSTSTGPCTCTVLVFGGYKPACNYFHSIPHLSFLSPFLLLCMYMYLTLPARRPLCVGCIRFSRVPTPTLSVSFNTSFMVSTYTLCVLVCVCVCVQWDRVSVTQSMNYCVLDCFYFGIFHPLHVCLSIILKSRKKFVVLLQHVTEFISTNVAPYDG